MQSAALLGRSLVGTMRATAADDIAIGPGANKAATINAALRAVAAAATPGSKGVVRLLRGTYRLEASLTLPSNVILRGDPDGRTVLIPTFTGEADAEANAVVKIEGTLDTATLNTTLTADARRHATSISVAAAGAVANRYLLLRGSNSGDDALGMSDGPSVVLSEIVQVASSYASGLTLPLAYPSQVFHGSTSKTVQAVNPIVGAEVYDLTIRGTGTTAAVGVLAKYAVDTIIEGIRGSVLTRAIVNLHAAKWFDVDRIRNEGETNSWVFQHSSQGGHVHRLTGKRGVARSHASGIPRHAVMMNARCTDVEVYDCELVGGIGGVFHAGGVLLNFHDIHIRDQEITDALYTRWVAGGEGVVGSRWPLGIGSGYGPLSIAEFAMGCTYTNISVTDVRGPNTGAWTSAAPWRALAFYLHDSLKVQCSNVTLVNYGAEEGVSGMLVSDCDGNFANLLIKGFVYSLSFNNVRGDIFFTNYRFDSPRSAAPGATIPIYLDYDPNANRGPRFNGVHVSNGFSFIRFGPSFVFDPNFEIRNLVTDQGEWDYCILANNQSGVAFSAGDVVEIDPTHTGTDRRIRTPDTGVAGFERRLAAVASGLNDDPGTGFLLIAKLPQNRATVRATTAAIAHGDGLAYAATRRVAASATGYLGASQSRKADGAEGFIRAGSG